MNHAHLPLAAALSILLALPAQAGTTRGALGWRAPSPDPAGMTEPERIEVAKKLYGEGDAAFKAGNFETALTNFERAYNVYARNFHVFNVNIGLAAFELGNCAKAKTAFQRFLDLVPEHPTRAEAQERLIEIERSGCAKASPPALDPAATPAPATASVTGDIEEAPALTRRSDDVDQAIDRERRERGAKKQHPLVVAGAVLTAIGGAALAGGAVSIAIASTRANKLADLASPGPSGFPNGNYSDDDVFNLDRNLLPGTNIATVVLFSAGGVIAATGITLLVIGLKQKKKERRSLGNAAARRGEFQATPTVLPGGGGVAATLRF